MFEDVALTVGINVPAWSLKSGCLSPGRT